VVSEKPAIAGGKAAPYSSIQFTRPMLGLLRAHSIRWIASRSSYSSPRKRLGGASIFFGDGVGSTRDGSEPAFAREFRG
jgi:hypothetical protein